MIGSMKVITNQKIIVMIKIKIMMKTIGPDMERPQYTIPNPKYQIHDPKYRWYGRPVHMVCRHS